MNRDEFVGLAAAINLAGIHEGNDGQRKTRVDAAVTMANALADALGMGGGNKGEPAVQGATPSLPPPGPTFGTDSASVPPTPGQIHPERAAKHDETEARPSTGVSPPAASSHEHERIQPEHKVPRDEPPRKGRY